VPEIPEGIPTGGDEVGAVILYLVHIAPRVAEIGRFRKEHYE
jgi:hypothetical protein